MSDVSLGKNRSRSSLSEQASRSAEDDRGSRVAVRDVSEQTIRRTVGVHSSIIGRKIKLTADSSVSSPQIRNKARYRPQSTQEQVYQFQFLIYRLFLGASWVYQP